MRWFAALMVSVRAFVVASLTGSSGVQAQQPSNADEAAWNAARSVDTAEAYRRYLEDFPVGSHVDEAFHALVKSTVENAYREIAPTRVVPVDLY